ncbi:hypothetical protein H4R22_003426 [Coemansia sp. RSA 1290]|nr:7,8-dihydro-8-oxoguanine triphosphatase-like protein [Coemansia mojavensis]KAJ1739858.1 hypothetical protein LPJ68_004306 [Coemansia sp. RSA 1086]KAJ1750515.1 hypothetical protein LPJ79_002857 [Coemansia sp. RSA 1821]KAJ1872208.1 hypothetical protein LPJ55_003304 [Coemansia sp. RSA 990]KAJ2629257.1 hypothetical protein H4R22_003426 [Coemansia sp. RSA 1290]KAJ2653260.1 hypothetical protein IWW40_000626 [Coemansia sp. RSA 1250]
MTVTTSDPRSAAHQVEDAELQKLPHRLYTLIFPLDKTRVLLGMKKRGFGSNKFNGFGGKVEPHETVEQGAIRELQEESGLCAQSVDSCGLLFFYFEDSPVVMEVHVFVAREYVGEVQETEEMRPQWFDFHNMPFEQMWADDPRWWPYLLKGQRFAGQFWFKADQVTITKENLRAI